MQETNSFELEGWRKRWLGGLTAGMLMCMFFLNTGLSSENNLRIAFVQIIFSGVVCLLLPRIRLVSNLLSGLFVTTVLLLLVGHFLALNDGLIYPSAGRLISFLIAMLFAVVIAHWTRYDIRAAPILATSALAAMVFYTLLLAIAWLQLPAPRSFDWFSAPPLFRHIRHLGYALAIAMICGTWLLLITTARTNIVAAAVGLCVVTAVILWSGGRGGVMAGLLGIICLLPLFPVARYGWRWLAVVLCLPFAFLMSLPFFVDHPGLGFLSAVQRTTESSGFNALSTARLAIWQDVLTYVAQRPLFGWGADAYIGLQIRPGYVQAHNGLMQLLLEWGIIPSVALSSLMLVVLHRGWRCWRRGLSDSKLAGVHIVGLGAALVIGLLGLATVDGTFYHGLPQAFLAAGFGLIAGGTEKWVCDANS